MVASRHHCTQREPSLAVTVADIRPLGRLASDAGIVVSDILAEVGFGRNLLQGDGDVRVGLGAYFRLLEHLAIAVRDETCHLSSRSLLPGSGAFVISSLSDCATLHEAMKGMAKSYNLLHGGSYNRIVKRNGMLGYIIDDRNFPYSLEHDKHYIQFTMECVLIFVHAVLSFISAGRISPLLRKVYCKRPRARGNAQHLAFWDVPVRYASANYALFYDRAAADLPVHFSEPELLASKTIYQIAIAAIENRPAPVNWPLSMRVREAIGRGMRDQKQIARQMNLSVATLRRRLSGEGLGFRELRHQVLNEAAKSLLGQGCHVCTTAEELGFSEPRSFIRAFKMWNGVTPKSYLDTLAQKATP